MTDPNKMTSVAKMLDKEAKGVWLVQNLFRFFFTVGGFFIYDMYLLLFVLFFAFMGMTKKRDMVSCREYYCCKLQIRRDSESIVLRTGRLFQQYVVDMYVKLETSKLDYFCSKQFEIRS